MKMMFEEFDAKQQWLIAQQQNIENINRNINRMNTELTEALRFQRPVSPAPYTAPQQTLWGYPQPGYQQSPYPATYASYYPAAGIPPPQPQPSTSMAAPQPGHGYYPLQATGGLPPAAVSSPPLNNFNPLSDGAGSRSNAPPWPAPPPPQAWPPGMSPPPFVPGVTAPVHVAPQPFHISGNVNYTTTYQDQDRSSAITPSLSSLPLTAVHNSIDDISRMSDRASKAYMAVGSPCLVGIFLSSCLLT